MSGSCPICFTAAASVAFVYDERPEGETEFDLGGRPYHREYLRCARCGHLWNRHELDLSGLYSGAYMDATYAGDRLLRDFARIMSLAPEASDNAQRVRRVTERLRPGSVLDVGSGLGVFPARMKEAGWNVTALDPDERAIEHYRNAIGVAAVRADFMDASSLGEFDLVTLNKVLEHVEDPVAMLARAREHLGAGGTVYVEVPDAEGAAADGPHREEFFIEHLHVFTKASLGAAAERAGLEPESVDQMREPSGKYTLVAFLTPRARL